MILYLREWIKSIVNNLVFYIKIIIFSIRIFLLLLFLMPQLYQSPIPQEVNHILRLRGLLPSLHFLTYVVIDVG